MNENIKDVFLITNREGSDEEPAKNVWTKIGVAFVNRDQSMNIILEALPINGRLHVRDRRPQKPVSF